MITKSDPPAPAPAGCKTPPPTFQSQALFQGGKVVVIVHQGRAYQLRITHAGKLILTA